MSETISIFDLLPEELFDTEEEANKKLKELENEQR